MVRLSHGQAGWRKKVKEEKKVMKEKVTKVERVTFERMIEWEW